MLVLIEDGEVFDPRPLGRTSVLIDDERIIKVGHVDRDALDRLDLEYEVLDAAGRLVVPGLIDPHQHLLGGSGEGSLARQTPMIFLSELIQAGVTTVVGLLGVDTTMKTMAGLLAKVKALKEDGLNAFCWTGGYSVPPTSIMESVRDDIMFIEEVIGAGEIAISDLRGLV
jgi:beta-aspartyl-dipeptidase (metallo-type)